MVCVLRNFVCYSLQGLAILFNYFPLVGVQSSLIFLFLRARLLGNGSSLISLEEHLKVETESRGHCQITVDVVGMNLESKLSMNLEV